MARTKGAKDKKLRQKPDPRNAQKPSTRPSRSAQTTPPVVTGASPAPQPESRPERSGISADEFHAAIAAELGQSGSASGSGQGISVESATCSPPAPDSFDPAALTVEGLANAWRLPFYGLARLLAWLRIAPDPEPIEAVGRRRAKELAKASYPIWDYYARQYVNVHPDQAVNVSIGVTVLDGIGIVPDLIDAVGESRRRAAKRAAVVQSPTPATAGQGGPVA